MKYVILIYGNPQSREIWEAFSEAQRGKGLQLYADLTEELSLSGELIATEALADRSLSKRVAIRDGRTLTTDGPFAEAKEELAGFFLVECESTERAIEIAAKIPEARLGLVEVRPTMVHSQMEM
jgi:hypothetical protein